MNNIINFILENPIDVILVIIFICPIIKGFLFKFSSKNLKNDIEDAGSYISFIIGSVIGIYVTKRIFIRHDDGIYNKIYNYIPEKFINVIEGKPIYIYILCMPIIIFIIYKVIEFLVDIMNRLTVYPILDGIENLLREKNTVIKRFIGAVFQLPKAICFVLLMTLVLNLLAILGVNSNYNKKLDKSVVYSFIAEEIVNPITNSHFAKELPNIINNSFKIVIKNGTDDEIKDSNKTAIVYYNGITLNEGIRSNKEIDNFSKSLTHNKEGNRKKAKAIYEWIGKNVDYDYDKVNRILNNDFSVKSGTINTFYTKKGICFDYACLYSAMAKASGLKVRIITGEGFNGSNWVSHAWNQVFLEDEGKWINIDTTFYKGGNYFDSTVFKLDHKNEKIAG